MEYLVITAFNDLKDEIAQIQLKITNYINLAKFKKENINYLLTHYEYEIKEIKIEIKDY